MLKNMLISTLISLSPDGNYHTLLLVDPTVLSLQECYDKQPLRLEGVNAQIRLYPMMNNGGKLVGGSVDCYAIGDEFVQKFISSAMILD